MIDSVQLLQKLSITAAGKREKLLRVIKNPVTQYFPLNSRKIGEHMEVIRLSIVYLLYHVIFISFYNQSLSKLCFSATGFSYSSEKLVDLRDYVAAISDDVTLVFVVC